LISAPKVFVNPIWNTFPQPPNIQEGKVSPRHDPRRRISARRLVVSWASTVSRWERSNGWLANSIPGRASSGRWRRSRHERLAPVTTLTKDDRGVWSATVGPLPPDLYRYFSEVDGVHTVDPKNGAIKIRSSSALQSRGLGNTVVHSENGRFVVTMSAARSARSEIDLPPANSTRDNW